MPILHTLGTAIRSVGEGLAVAAIGESTAEKQISLSSGLLGAAGLLLSIGGFYIERKGSQQILMNRRQADIFQSADIEEQSIVPYQTKKKTSTLVIDNLLYLDSSYALTSSIMHFAKLEDSTEANVGLLLSAGIAWWGSLVLDKSGNTEFPIIPYETFRAFGIGLCAPSGLNGIGKAINREDLDKYDIAGSVFGLAGILAEAILSHYLDRNIDRDGIFTRWLMKASIGIGLTVLVDHIVHGYENRFVAVDDVYLLYNTILLALTLVAIRKNETLSREYQIQNESLLSNGNRDLFENAPDNNTNNMNTIAIQPGRIHPSTTFSQQASFDAGQALAFQAEDTYQPPRLGQTSNEG